MAVWRPIQEHPWKPSRVIVACFSNDTATEFGPDVEIFEALCSKGNYFHESAGRPMGMTTLLEEGWAPFAWLDGAPIPDVPSESEMQAATEHFRDALGGVGRADLK